MRLLITEDKIRGYIMQNGKATFITQLYTFDGNISSKNILITYTTEDVIDKNVYCGVESSQEQQFLQQEVQNKTISSTTNNNCRTLELATEADYEFYQRYGSGSNTEVLAIINMIEGLYQNTFNMKINVTYQSVWTNSNDPFTGNPSTLDGAELLTNELRNYWESNRQGVQRDLVHLFSGRDYNQSGVFGRVYEIGTVCSARNKSYGFTKDRVNQFLTTAHEIGHNFGGIHSDGQNCGTSNASIMCQGDKAIPMYFSSASITRMTNFMNANSSCMAIYYSMTGPSQICTTATYSIPDVPSGTNITWNITGTYAIIGSNPSNSEVTVQRNAHGYGTLTATITTTNCGVYTVTNSLSPLAINFSAWGNDNGYCGVGDASVDIPNGNTFNWEVTGDLSINFGGQTLTNTSNTVTITGTNGTIIVTTTACGGPLYLDYNHEPYKRDIIVAANPMIGSDPLSASIQNIDFPYTAINWYIDGIQVTNPWSNPEMFFDTGSPPCGMHVLSAEAVLECGLTAEIGSVEIERYCTGWWRTMVVYPNPASSYLLIAPDAEKQKNLSAMEKSKMKEYEASLYDINGKLLLKGRSDNYKLQLDTRKLKADNYFLHIRMDGDKEVIKQQIIIRK